jgi:ubiquinone biosynthesis protein UbiJ
LPIPALVVVNHLLGQASWARKKLSPYAGHSAKISMPPFEAAFLIVEDGLLATTSDDAEPEVTITLPATTPLLALQGHDVVLGCRRGSVALGG